MDPISSRLPTFESLSPSGRYGELTRYCVDRLEQILQLMLDSDAPGFQPSSLAARDLLDTLGRRRQTLHKGFLFQLQRQFTDFKSIRPARLYPRSDARNAPSSGVFDTHGNSVQPRIEAIDKTLLLLLEPRLFTLDQRMKYLVHRSDEGLQDNPLRPARLCEAFIAAIEPLGFNRERTLPLLEAFGELLEQQLSDLYRCCDRGLFELGIRDDLPCREEDRPVDIVVSGEAETLADDTADDTSPEPETAEETLSASAESPLSDEEARQDAFSVEPDNQVESTTSETNEEIPSAEEMPSPAPMDKASVENAPEEASIPPEDSNPYDLSHAEQASGTQTLAESPEDRPEQARTISVYEAREGIEGYAAPNTPDRTADLTGEEPDTHLAVAPTTPPESAAMASMEAGAGQARDESSGGSANGSSDAAARDVIEEAVAEILADAQSRRTLAEEETDAGPTIEEIVDTGDESPAPEEPSEAASAQLLSFGSQSSRLLENESARLALEALKENTEALAGDLSSFHACVQQLQVIAPPKTAEDLQKFSRFYGGLITNPHVSEPLRLQLLRLTTPLLHLVLHDPFFFRSSNHPVNDFLHSMIDFEIRHGHRPENIKVLSLLVDNLLQQEQPVLSDFQPITQGYEVFKQLEVERLKEEKKTREAEQVRLKSRLLDWIQALTEPLEVEKDALAFFYDDWQLYLLQLARQYGEHSPEVQDAFELARILAWSLDRNRSENAHYAAQRFTALLRKIDKAMRCLDYSHEHRQHIRRTLIREFREANRRPTLIQAATPVHAEKPAVQPFFGMLGAEPPRWARAAVSREPTLYPDVASMIQIGDWIEVKPQPGSRSNNPQRGKLRWQSTDGIYRFFNQRGSIILETDAEGLNRLFARGEASLLKPFSSTGLGGSLGHSFRIYR